MDDPRDRGLATELAYGYMRHKLRLEHLAALHLAKPERTHPMVLRACALGAYELVFLDSVPAHATLSWTVEAVKQRLGQTHASVVNAVLRRIQTLGPDAREQEYFRETTRDEAHFARVWHSCPDWLFALWRKDYGPERAARLLSAQSLPPLTGVRVNMTRQGADTLIDSLQTAPGCVAARAPWFGFAPGRQEALEGIYGLEQSGALSRQSVAVGEALHSLGASAWQAPVWDACAGRGGKSLALAELGVGPVLASDPSLKRLRHVTAEASRLGVPAPRVFRCDASAPALRPFSGTILLDAPCSGLGVLSRRPDAKWKRTQADVSALAALQGRIIESAAGTLASGGTLVYMTCTMTKAENEQQAQRIESLGFAPVALLDPFERLELRELFWGGVWRKS